MNRVLTVTIKHHPDWAGRGSGGSAHPGIGSFRISQSWVAVGIGSW
jgi:hypothetical protein